MTFFHLNDIQRGRANTKFSSINKYGGGALSADDIANIYNGNNGPATTSKTAAFSKMANVAVYAYACFEIISQRKNLKSFLLSQIF